MQEKIKTGIIGLGRAGFGMQCSELDEKKDRFEIIAGCDTHKPWLERMREHYPSCSLYDNVDGFLTNSEIELVSIATRSVDHFKHAMLSLKAGKNVIIDKPMCTTYDEAIELQKAAEKSKGKLFIRHNRRFDPDFLRIKEIINSGTLGYVHTMKLCRAGFGRRSDWQTLKQNGGGQLLNWGPHIIDHALQFLGAPEKPIKNIWSELKLLVSGGDSEDHFKIIIKGHNDCIVDIEISSAAATPLPEYFIWGTRGSLVLSLSDRQIRLKYLDVSEELGEIKVDNGTPSENFGEIKPKEYKWIEETLEVPPDIKFDTWDALYESIRNNKEFPITLAQSVEVMRIISEAKKGTNF